MNFSNLSEIVNYCDKILNTKFFKDYEGAVNGLQFQNNGVVKKIGAAVDATLKTFKLAAKEKCDLIIVHHGLMWNPYHPYVGARYEIVKLLIQNNIAVYSSHLPLDAHPKFGNNAVLCKRLGLFKIKPFFNLKGQPIGFKSKTSINREELFKRLENIFGKQPLLIPSGPEICKNIGVVSGGAGPDLEIAKDENIDTFITGEGPHWTVSAAELLNINVFYAGHYSTETLGVKALAEHLAKKFKIKWLFIDNPTNL
ncbi:MAG: Nif3-like dinuclear metal center hexameric protein [Verrucomicrobiia bacterium]